MKKLFFLTLIALSVYAPYTRAPEGGAVSGLMEGASEAPVNVLEGSSADGTGRTNGEGVFDDGIKGISEDVFGKRDGENSEIGENTSGGLELEDKPLYKSGGIDTGDITADNTSGGNGDGAPESQPDSTGTPAADTRTALQKEDTSSGKTDPQTDGQTRAVKDNEGTGLGRRSDGDGVKAVRSGETAGKNKDEIKMREDNFAKLQSMDKKQIQDLTSDELEFLEKEYERLFGKKKNDEFKKDDINGIYNAQQREIALLNEGLTGEAMKRYSDENGEPLAQVMKILADREAFMKMDVKDQKGVFSKLLEYQKKLDDAITKRNEYRALTLDEIKEINEIASLLGTEDVDTEEGDSTLEERLKTMKDGVDREKAFAETVMKKNDELTSQAPQGDDGGKEGAGQPAAEQPTIESVYGDSARSYLAKRKAQRVEDSEIIKKYQKARPYNIEDGGIRELNRISRRFLGRDAFAKSMKYEEYLESTNTLKQHLEKEKTYLDKEEPKPIEDDPGIQYDLPQEVDALELRSKYAVTKGTRGIYAKSEGYEDVMDKIEEVKKILDHSKPQDGEILQMRLSLAKLRLQGRFIDDLIREKTYKKLDKKSNSLASDPEFPKIYEEVTGEKFTGQESDREEILRKLKQKIVKKRASEASKLLTDAVKKVMPEGGGDETQGDSKELSIKERFERLLQKIRIRIKAILGNKKSQLQIVLQKAGKDAQELETLLSTELNEEGLQNIDKLTKKLISDAEKLTALRVHGELSQAEAGHVHKITGALRKAGGASQSDTGQGDTGSRGSPQQAATTGQERAAVS